MKWTDVLVRFLPRRKPETEADRLKEAERLKDLRRRMEAKGVDMSGYSDEQLAASLSDFIADAGKSIRVEDFPK